ncbi:retrovirus-related pol polyprotein from transposon TNT 1-94 [Tanacetum coccineum]
MGVAINGLRTRIDKTLLEDRQRRWISDCQNSLREFYKTDVILMSASLSKNLKELKEELIEEKNELLKAELEKSSSDSKDIQANLLKRIKILENDFNVKNSNCVRRPKSKDTKSKDGVLKNNNDKRPSAHVRKMSSSVSINSNKHETMHSNVCQSYANVLSTKTVNAVNDGSNIVCVSYGKDVFLLSHEKCVARYALSRNSSIKRALFTTPIAAKSKNLGANFVGAKSRLSVAKIQIATNKVSSVLPLSFNSIQSRTLSNYKKNKIAASRKWQKWFENQQCFNWTPKSKTAQSLPSETKNHIRVCSTSNTLVTTWKWVAKPSTLPSTFFHVMQVIQLFLWIVDNECSKHMTSNLQLLRNFIEKFMGIVRFRNVHFAAITGYGDYVQGNLMICQYTTLKALIHINKSWLRHRRLSHLNFGTINQLTSKDLVDGLPKFKYNQDHLCSVCEQGNSKKAFFPPKLVPSTKSKLELLHIDLCGPMRVASINGKKYILVIINDYSWYTWVYFLRTKDEASDMIIDFINQVQMNLKAQILTIRTDNGNEFKNEKLQAFYEKFDLDNLFGPLSEEYYATSSPEVSDNSAANTLDNENISSSSSIVVEEDEAPQIVSSSAEQVSTEPNS